MREFGLKQEDRTSGLSKRLSHHRFNTGFWVYVKLGFETKV